MKKCIRCNSEMFENLEIRTNEAFGITFGEKGMFKGSLGRIKAAVCPECGYLETYIEDTEKLRNAMKSEK